MWIAKFRLRDDEDIYSYLCEKYNIEFFAVPYTNFIKNKKINLLVGGILEGNQENKKEFIQELVKDKRVKNVENYHDYIFVHAQHNLSRESKKEIKIFYNSQYLLVKPVRVSSERWEYWEVGCLNRNELNKVVRAARKYYHGELFSLKKEKIKSVSSLTLSPGLTNKQHNALYVALKEGYYNYPRKLTLPSLAKKINVSYSTFQEHLRKAESKVLTYFFKYR